MYLTNLVEYDELIRYGISILYHNVNLGTKEFRDVWYKINILLESIYPSEGYCIEQYYKYEFQEDSLYSNDVCRILDGFMNKANIYELTVWV